ncbi:hypothetical protein SPRG_16450 [Saprolegnia parasitica CBS 223.65]|uniref:Uncharacterized protein n=1 Tax=Saprolegnia parasitica (strain CBS 223.65) TaxID=695850 RepID=A0A067BIJ5_SAPPC|nr:hypothetical protein SPRG_16450 [Saprolegnia parasitica CBS 223.65]KDO18003.1 hypothetical protein SPRG_16450 [Saprolegnia parasitica CBS 223.65]|eukprot:XP_012211287.1 hypothetical protein SPRG_16450 [Saprolegnia parasitica CBS 223.65]
MASETQLLRGIAANEKYSGAPEVGLGFYGGRRQVTRYVKDRTLANRFSIVVAKAGVQMKHSDMDPSPMPVVVAVPSTSTILKGKKKMKEQDVVAYLKAINPEH